ncbi:MAG: hypothetical protein LBC88_07430 [Spirochaetaceae bacterium]|jgi:hypothetical protein|nr:hypothetical protein [Spirochaetaceae bacterium]
MAFTPLQTIRARSGAARVFLAALFAAGFLSSCRPIVDLPVLSTINGLDHKYYVDEKHYGKIFQTIWTGINNNYVFWELEPLEYWDQVWDTYKPKFDRLGTGGADDALAIQYFREMFEPLKEGHLRLEMFQGSAPEPAYELRPGRDRVDARFNGTGDDRNPFLAFSGFSYYQTLVPPTVRPAGGINIREVQSVPNYTGAAVKGKINLGDGTYIAYFYFNQFSFSNGTGSPGAAAYRAFLAGFVDNPGCRGLIFDVRGNTGGNAKDIALLLGPLLSDNLTVAHIRYKKGEGRLNYLPWTPWVIEAAAPENRIVRAGELPIVALVNDYSASCAEILALALKTMPHGELVGTCTFGATGLRFGDSPIVLSGGSFNVVAGNTEWRITEAGFQTRGPDFTNYEAAGIEPAFIVPFSQSDFAAGNDAQLEKAMLLIQERGR